MYSNKPQLTNRQSLFSAIQQFLFSPCGSLLPSPFPSILVTPLVVGRHVVYVIVDGAVEGDVGACVGDIHIYRQS